MSYFFNKYYRNDVLPDTSREAKNSEIISTSENVNARSAGRPMSDFNKYASIHPFMQPYQKSSPMNSSNQRWKTMKHDFKWLAYNDFPRRHNPSDYTGKHKMLLG
jgi:hypothetical protein